MNDYPSSTFKHGNGLLENSIGRPPGHPSRGSCMLFEKQTRVLLIDAHGALDPKGLDYLLQRIENTRVVYEH